jgi:hypothetical protein
MDFLILLLGAVGIILFSFQFRSRFINPDSGLGVHKLPNFVQENENSSMLPFAQIKPAYKCFWKEFIFF